MNCPCQPPCPDEDRIRWAASVFPPTCWPLGERWALDSKSRTSDNARPCPQPAPSSQAPDHNPGRSTQWPRRTSFQVNEVVAQSVLSMHRNRTVPRTPDGNDHRRLYLLPRQTKGKPDTDLKCLWYFAGWGEEVGTSATCRRLGSYYATLLKCSIARINTRSCSSTVPSAAVRFRRRSPSCRKDQVIAAF